MNQIIVRPLIISTWPDFERLFGPNGACAGCWCTWWRLSSKDFRNFSKEEKKNVLRTLVQSGKKPGLIAYEGDIPVGWVSVAPREEFLLLENSKKLARVDDLPVWSVNCFFIERHHRRAGLTRILIDEAVKFAAANGADIVEAYPIDVHEKVSSLRLYYGHADTFRQAGFVEVARREPEQPIMRKTINRE
jgi:GNAT superfamily N-acetyltransferase